MNIFVCDPEPAAAAQMLADKHVVKMTVETAQILSTACHLVGISFDTQYRMTHTSHPCVKGLLKDPSYLLWTSLHGLNLCLEFRYRFGKVHASEATISDAIDALTDLAEVSSLRISDVDVVDSYPRAVLEDFKTLKTVDAYRAHLRRKYLSWPDVKWTGRTRPAWSV